MHNNFRFILPFILAQLRHSIQESLALIQRCHVLNKRILFVSFQKKKKKMIKKKKKKKKKKKIIKKEKKNTNKKT